MDSLDRFQWYYLLVILGIIGVAFLTEALR